MARELDFEKDGNSGSITTPQVPEHPQGYDVIVEAGKGSPRYPNGRIIIGAQSPNSIDIGSGNTVVMINGSRVLTRRDLEDCLGIISLFFVISLLGWLLGSKLRNYLKR